MRPAPARNNFGRGCLLARKLVEAGVACVEITLGGWDQHAGIFNGLATRQLPTLDKGMGTLVKDLAQRRQAEGHRDRVDGRLRPHPADQPERRPRPLPGRVERGDGWRQTSRAASPTGPPTRDGTQAVDNKVGVHDVYGTLYRGLGIDPTPETNASVRDNLGRPYYLAGDRTKTDDSTDAKIKDAYWIKDLVG